MSSSSPEPAPVRPDPWAVPDGRSPRRWAAPAATGPVRLAGALALGAGAPVARHLGDGVPGRAAAVALAASVIVAAGSVVPARLRVPVQLLVAALATAVMPSGGHRGMAVAGLGVVAAHGALADRARGDRGGVVAVARLAVPLSIAASLVWWRARSLLPPDDGPYTVAFAFALGLHGAALVVAELRTRWAERSEAAEAAVGRAVAAVGVAVAAVIVFVVAIPVLYLPGSLGRGWAARPWRRRSSTTWVLRAGGREEDRRHAAHPFAATPSGERRRRFLRVGAVAAVGALVVVGLRWGDGQATDPVVADRGPAPGGVLGEQVEVRFSDLPAFEGVPFADDLKAEQDRFAGSLVDDPVTGFASPDFAGTYTNVQDGVRATIEPSCACPSATVWLVGGSVAFGLGQRDDHTIASELVRLADADGIALEVVNLATPGWTLWQEAAAVQARLAEVDPSDRPDLIVSVGGFNDVIGTLVAGALGRLDPDVPARLDTEQILEFSRRGLGVDDAGGVAAVAATARRSIGRQATELIRSTGDRGIATRLFFHADALASPRQFAPVADIFRGLPPDGAAATGELLELVSSGLEPTVTDLRHLYDDEPTSVYADWAHTNERGARLAAAAIWTSIGGEAARRSG